MFVLAPFHIILCVYVVHIAFSCNFHELYLYLCFILAVFHIVFLYCVSLYQSIALWLQDLNKLTYLLKYRGAGGIRLRLSEQMRLELSFDGVHSTAGSNVLWHSEFQMCGAATEKDRRANSVRVLGAFSSGASDDRRGRTGTAVWIS